MGIAVRFTYEALQHLVSLEDYLAVRFYPGNAERYTDRITKACLSLGFAPERGTRRESLGPGVRVLGFERRVSIYFRVTEVEVVILGIYYAGVTPRLKL